MNELIIVSFYTKNTLYEKDAENLIKSCQNHDLKYFITPIESKGRWDLNCCYKPLFLLECLKKFEKPLLWVDVDAWIVQKPHLSLTCDLAVRIDPEREWTDPSKVRTGTAYVAPTKSAEDLLKEWYEVCQEMLKIPSIKEVWDQICLKALLPRPNVETLPPGYCAIFDYWEDQNLGKDLYIVHTQASRLYKKFINGEVASFLDELSFEQLQDLRPKL